MNALAHEAPRILLKVRDAITWIAHHTGLPALVVAAIALVVSLRFVKKASRFLVEVAVVAALFFVATKLGWLRW